MRECCQACPQLQGGPQPTGRLIHETRKAISWSVVLEHEKMQQNEGNAQCQQEKQRKTKMNVIYPWPHSRPGSRLAGYTPLPHTLLSNRPICRMPLACSLGSREYSGPGTALLLGAILLLPSHCPRGSLSLLLCHPLPRRLQPLDRLPETGLGDRF